MYAFAPQTDQVPFRLTLDHIEPFIRPQGRAVAGRFRNLDLRSEFQPILSLTHQRAVGFEALLRPRAAGGRPLSPLDVFDSVRSEVENVFLDRLSRLIHIHNFRAQDDAVNWLFLNINPLVTVHGRRHGPFFSEVLAQCGLAPHRVVVEILEGQIEDEGLLGEAVAYYRELGCLIAIDDFGAGHSNFDRMWRLSPHIIKLDRSIIVQAASNRKMRRILPNLVNPIHEAGSMGLMEGIETESEALIAMDSGIDLVQGYHFGKPSPAIALSSEHSMARLQHLGEKFHSTRIWTAREYRRDLHPYVDAVQVVVQQFTASADAAAASRAFLALPRAERCYLLGPHGRQLGPNYCSTSQRVSADPRFGPLADTTDAVWARRQYFRDAVAQPGEIQTSNPYLSLTGGNMCVTLSAAIFSGKELVVLCADLTWND